MVRAHYQVHQPFPLPIELAGKVAGFELVLAKPPATGSAGTSSNWLTVSTLGSRLSQFKIHPVGFIAQW